MKSKTLGEKIFALYIINKGSVHQMYNKHFFKNKNNIQQPNRKIIAKKVHRQFTEVVS